MDETTATGLAEAERVLDSDLQALMLRLMLQSAEERNSALQSIIDVQGAELQRKDVQIEQLLQRNERIEQELAIERGEYHLFEDRAL